LPNVTPSRVPPPGITEGAIGPHERHFNQRAWLYLLLLPVVVIAILLGASALLRRVHPHLDWIGVLMVLAAVFGAFFAWAYLLSWLTRTARRRDAHEVEQLGFRVCLRCRYHLDQLPAEGLCPECGTDYTPSSLADSWRWTYLESRWVESRSSLS
jgi:hypothetical protein